MSSLVQEITRRIKTYMQEAQLDPELIYAFEKTGRIVTDDNLHLLTREDLAEWDAACKEYRVLAARGQL